MAAEAPNDASLEAPPPHADTVPEVVRLNTISLSLLFKIIT